LFIGSTGELCVMQKRRKYYGYPIIKDYFDDAVKVEILSEKKSQNLTPVDKYIDDLLKWKKYILKYHIDSVWNSLKKDTESITDANLVLLKLCSDEIHSHYDAWKRAGEIGLPTIEGFKTTTLKSARCPYLEEIKKAFEEKRSFNYHWRGSYDYSAEGKKYLKETNKLNWELDKDAISKDEMFDGYYAIETSKTGMSVNDILEAHHTLWKIEESFRIMKSTMEVRPIFHWTEKRIKGHFVVCFLSFLLERTLELTLKENNIKASSERIREALNSLNIATFETGGKKYYLKIRGIDLGNKILRLLRINPLKNIAPYEELKL